VTNTVRNAHKTLILTQNTNSNKLILKLNHKHYTLMEIKT